MTLIRKYWRLNPGLALLFSLVLVATVMTDRWLEYEYNLIPQEKQRQQQFFRESTARMWQTVSDLMLVDRRATTESYMTSFSADSGFESIALVFKGQVLLSNRFAQQGSSSGDLSCYQAGWVNQAVTRFRPVLQDHPNRLNQLCAVMPITLRERSASLRPDSLGVLVVQYDMSPAIESLKQQIWRPGQWLRQLGFALAVALLLSVIIRLTILSPLTRIRRSMQQYAEGNLLARAAETGRSELTEVAHNFNELADRVNEASMQVRRNEQRWIKALDAAGDGVWDWDMADGSLYFSRQWKKMLGYGEKEVENLPEQWRSRIHPDDLTLATGAFISHLKGETPVYRCVYRMSCKDGRYKWFYDRGMVFERDLNGRALRVIGTLSDITEQKRTEQALQESQQQFELAMLGSNDGLWDWNILRSEVYYSPRWKQMLGYRDEELENNFSVWERLLHPDDIARAKEEIGLCVTGKKDHYEVEFRLHHKEGHWVSVLSRAVVVKDRQGGVVRLVGTHMDLTEIRTIQQQLEESRRQLKQLAFYDALTGLPNRRLLEERMDKLLKDDRVNGEVTAVAMMDLDGFKQVNDTLGHDVGDELLKAVAGRLRLCMRDSDTVARLGGDEFVLLLTAPKGSDDVFRVLDRVIATLAKPYRIGEHNCHVTASIGVAYFPQDAHSGDLLLRYADLAMYRSKQAGRNRYSIYEGYMSEFDQENIS